MSRILVVGPTSRPWAEIADEVEGDLARLARPGVELVYRCTGSGPTSIRSEHDVVASAPGVLEAARRGATEGFDAVIVDCTEDPGVDEARAELDIPVVGPGAALRAAASRAAAPVVWLSGDELRSSTTDQLLERARAAATVVLGGTGWSHVADVLRRDRPGLVVLDPLPVALERCLAGVQRPTSH
jgi:Asp/Glu/hydantoin racemase